MTEAKPISVPPPPGETSGARVARNAFFLVLGQIATTVLAVALSAVLGRALGAADFGVFFLVTSMALFGQVIVDWGQSQFMIGEVARAPKEAGILLGSVLVMRTVGGVVMSGLTAATAYILFDHDLKTVGAAAAMVLAMIPFHLAQGFGTVFRGREHMELDSAVSVFNKAFTVGATLLLLAIGTGLMGAIVAQALGGIVAVAMAAVLVRRLALSRLWPNWASVKRLLVGGTPILLLSLAVALQTYLDAIVISSLAAPESVGCFGAARNIFGTLMAPANILAAAAYPALARAAGDPKRFAREVQMAMRPLLALAALGAVGMYLFADGAVRLIYGDRGFGPAGDILKIFAPGLFLLFIDLLVATAVLAHGRPQAFAVAKWVSLIGTTVLAVILVPHFERQSGNGGIGIAIAFAASEVLMLATGFWILPKGTFHRRTLLDCVRTLAVGGGTLAIVQALPQVPLAVGIAVCTVSFSLLALALRLVRVDELVEIVSHVRAGRNRAL